MKYLCVLLTKYPDRFARVLARLSGRGYTHASIGLEDGNRFYSFSFRGFTEETPDKLRRRGVTAGRCYRIPVADGALSPGGDPPPGHGRSPGRLPL